MDEVHFYLPKEMAQTKEQFLVYALKTMVEAAQEEKKDTVSSRELERLLIEADKRYGRTKI
jgi:hypothetical protein